MTMNSCQAAAMATGLLQSHRWQRCPKGPQPGDKAAQLQPSPVATAAPSHRNPRCRSTAREVQSRVCLEPGSPAPSKAKPHHGCCTVAAASLVAPHGRKDPAQRNARRLGSR
jgi:hypothetical protein